MYDLPPAFYTICFIISIIGFLWLLKDWLYMKLSYREMKKLCGSIHPYDFIVLQIKKIQLKDCILQETKKEYLGFIELMKRTGRKIRNKK